MEMPGARSVIASSPRPGRPLRRPAQSGAGPHGVFCCRPPRPAQAELSPRCGGPECDAAPPGAS
jgi:hypothetical protein